MKPLQVFFTFSCALRAHHAIFPLNYELKRAYAAYLLLLIESQGLVSIIRGGKNEPGAGFTRNLRTYSGAPVWIPSLRRRELGGIEPDQRGEGLRHPVGDHRHGAEHDADLQQRHRHLCALLGLFFKPSSFYRLR